MRVYKFIDAEWGLKSIGRKTLKVSKFEELNDPFELAADALDTRGDRKKFQDARKKFMCNHRIICFSASWSNPVMWAHYANGHMGMALGFDVPDKLLQEVEYSSQRRKEAAIGTDFERLSTMKFAHWNYENEWRWVLSSDDTSIEGPNEAGALVRPFDDQLRLAEIILGANYDGATHSKPRLPDGVRVVTSRMAFKSFRIVEQRDKNLQKAL